MGCRWAVGTVICRTRISSPMSAGNLGDCLSNFESARPHGLAEPVGHVCWEPVEAHENKGMQFIVSARKTSRLVVS